MDIAGITWKKIQKPNQIAVVSATLPVLYILFTITNAYNSIGKFVIAGLIVLVGELFLWQKLTRKVADFTKKLSIILPLLMIFVASVGFGASFSLAKEKQALERDPGHVASCSISPIVSCTASVTASQGSALGVSNPSLGMVAYGILLIGGASLLLGLKFVDKWWIAVWSASLFGLSYNAWLIYQSLYVIGALCLYCSTIWAVTIALFTYISIFIVLDKKLINISDKFKKILVANHNVPMFILYGVVILLVYFRWSDYWNSLL